jgi:hypothetical protein
MPLGMIRTVGVKCLSAEPIVTVVSGSRSAAIGSFRRMT